MSREKKKKKVTAVREIKKQCNKTDLNKKAKNGDCCARKKIKTNKERKLLRRGKEKQIKVEKKEEKTRKNKNRNKRDKKTNNNNNKNRLEYLRKHKTKIRIKLPRKRDINK